MTPNKRSVSDLGQQALEIGATPLDSGAKEALQEEAMLRLFFDLPFLGMVIYDPHQQTWVRFNERFCTMLGYTTTEMLGLSWRQVTHPHDVQTGVTKIQQVLAGETEGYTREKRFLHKDGFFVYALVDVKGIRDSENRVQYLMVTVQDITPYRQVIKDLRHSEERFRATFEQAAVGIAHVAPDGTWLWVNQTLCDLVGYSREELQRLTFQDITHPEDLDTDLAYVQEMLNRQRTSYTMEKRYIRKDGRIVWINLTVSLVWNNQNQPDYFISVIQDISQAKQNQETLRHYTQRLQGLHTMDRAILSKFRPPAMAQAALTLLHQLLGCERSLVALFHPQSAQAEVVADTADADHRPAETRWPLEDFVYGQGFDQPCWRIDDLTTLESPVPLLQGLHGCHQRSVLTVPLRVDNRVIGEITLSDPQVAYFQADHEAMAQETANHLAIALQNACLFEQVQADRQRLQELSTQLLDAQESERRWLAQELHDEVGQALTAVKLNLQRLQRLMASDSDSAQAILEDGLHLADGALQQVRNLSLDLRPSLLDDLGLVPALRWYVSRHADRTGLAETLICDLQMPPLPAATETACFRIVQEALTNIARHAQARQATVRLARSDQYLRLTIQDDGVGFDSQAANHRQGGTSLGLLGMAERAQHIGGQLSITARPGQGTTVELQAPLVEGDRLSPETCCAIFSQDSHGPHYPDHCR
ncbi:MAG: PAS domain S-box protein [Spirulina sp.]